MNNTVYEDNKYCMQDVSSVYIGCKFTFEELLENDTIPFKFQMLVERYIVSETAVTDSLESHLYYLPEKVFLVRIYEQLKAKVKINILEEKKSLIGGTRQEYTTKVVPIRKLVQMTPEEKKNAGIVIQELVISKLALMAF